MDKGKISIEWIDRIFLRLNEAYGARFATKFSTPTILDLEKERWQAALFGASGEEIKRVLDMCKRQIIPNPPNAMEFFYACKKISQPTPKKMYHERTERQQKVQSAYLKLIMGKLNGTLDDEQKAELSAISEKVIRQENAQQNHWQDK